MTAVARCGSSSGPNVVANPPLGRNAGGSHAAQPGPHHRTFDALCAENTVLDRAFRESEPQHRQLSANPQQNMLSPPDAAPTRMFHDGLGGTGRLAGILHT